MLPTFHVVDDFLHRTVRLTIQHHFELPLFHLHHHRLLAHPSDHVERIFGLPA